MSGSHMPSNSAGACHVARQLLEGATAGELRGTHEVLQRAVQEAPGRTPAAALPALEASLLALETAEGRALASQVRSILVVVP